MEKLNCYLCHRDVDGELNGLTSHFINVHGLTLSRGVGSAGFECGQHGCRRKFLHFFSLRQHIRKRHLNFMQRDSEFNNNNNHNNDVNMDFHTNNINDNNINEEDINHINENDMNNYEDNNDNNENNNSSEEFNIYSHVIRMVARFQCKSSMTTKTLIEILDECEELLLNTRDFLKSKVSEFFLSRDLMTDDAAKNVLAAFDFENPFNKIRTLDNQISALESYCGYINPIEIPLGYRMDVKLHSNSGTYKPAMVMETFQYVPIIDTLKLVLSSPNIRQIILTEQKSSNDILHSFLDGQHAQNHPFFLRYPHAIRLQLYYDEFEIVNPLGAKTGIHKLGAFYYIIQNLPAHVNSELSSIHVLLLCSDADVKKYGFYRILLPFLNDLAKLESDEGVSISINGEDFCLRASIAAFCGDGLAVHDVFNFLGPSCNQFCRLCMYSRDDLHLGSLELGQERTKDLFALHLVQLSLTNFSAEIKTATGLRGDSCLHASRYFHISENKIFDPMHDLLCGICPMMIKLILKEYVLVQKKFSLDYFNGMITHFQWGYCEMVNKPTANFTDSILRRKDHLISQKAMQVWTLMRAFPFIISDKISEDDEHLDLIINLLQIMEIAFAPKLTRSLIPYLDALITEFRMKFRSLFPDIYEINKMHHLSHYPQCILWSGPLVNYWCMRFEAKHADIKTRAQVVRNFKNPAKTLIRVAQCGQSAKWGTQNVHLYRFSAMTGRIKLINETLSRQFLINMNYVDDSRIFCSNSLRVNGVEFRIGLYTLLEVAHVRPDNLPLFGWIKEIVVVNNTDVYFLISVCKSINLDTSLNAYLIERNDETDSECFRNVFQLAYFKPFCCWRKVKSRNLYISLRHIVL